MNSNGRFTQSSFLAKNPSTVDLSHLDRKVHLLQLPPAERERCAPFCCILLYTQSWEVGTNCMMKGFVVHLGWGQGDPISARSRQDQRTAHGVEFENIDNKWPCESI